MRSLIIGLIISILLFSGVSFATQSLQIISTVTPSSIAPGTDGFVTLTITNTAAATYTQSLKIKSLSVDSPIALTSGIYTNNLGSLSPSKATSTIVRFEVPSGTSSGFYSMNFLIEACDTSSVCNNFVHNTVITVQSPSNLEISSVEPTGVMAGERVTLDVIVTNNGNSEINNILLSWEVDDDTILPLGSDNRKSISKISGNSKVSVPIKVVVNPDATPGVNSLDFEITYDDATGTANSINSSVGLMVTGNFNFIVTLENQDIVTPGMGGNVNIKIANAGTQEAQFLTITGLESYPITKINPKITYVGNLESDDYNTEKVGFVVGDTTPGEYPLNIELSYKDLYGNEYSDNYSLDITIYSREFVASQSADYNWLFYIVIIILAYLLYRKFRKKKR